MTNFSLFSQRNPAILLASIKSTCMYIWGVQMWTPKLQTVVAISFHLSRLAIGVPTGLLRPTTTANFLLMLTPVLLINSKQALGVPLH
jgi:hypothetical protein